MNRALLFLLTAFSLLAQQTVNNFTVKTNLTVIGSAVDLSVDTISELISLNAVGSNIKTVSVARYSTNVAVGVGAGTYVWAPSYSGTTNAYGGALAVTGGAWILSGSEVDVRQFGASGDGVTDDTDRLQAALEWSENRKLNLPEGTYLVTKASLEALPFYGLSFRNNSVVEWRGGKVILETGVAVRHIFCARSPGYALTNVTILNPVVDAQESMANLFGFAWGGNESLSVRDIRIRGGTLLNAKHDPDLNGFGGGRAVTFQFGARDCIVSGVTVRNCHTAFDVHGNNDEAGKEVRRVTFSGCSVYDCEFVGTVTDLSDSAEPTNNAERNILSVIFSDITFENCGLSEQSSIGDLAFERVNNAGNGDPFVDYYQAATSYDLNWQLATYSAAFSEWNPSASYSIGDKVKITDNGRFGAVFGLLTGTGVLIDSIRGFNADDYGVIGAFIRGDGSNVRVSNCSLGINVESLVWLGHNRNIWPVHTRYYSRPSNWVVENVNNTGTNEVVVKATLPVNVAGKAALSLPLSPRQIWIGGLRLYPDGMTGIVDTSMQVTAAQNLQDWMTWIEVWNWKSGGRIAGSIGNVYETANLLTDVNTVDRYGFKDGRSRPILVETYQSNNQLRLQRNGSASGTANLWVNTGILNTDVPMAVQGTGATIRAGSGTPIGSVSANLGSIYQRTDTSGATVYLKDSGSSGNTGWKLISGIDPSATALSYSGGTNITVTVPTAGAPHVRNTLAATADTYVTFSGVNAAATGELILSVSGGPHDLSFAGNVLKPASTTIPLSLTDGTWNLEWKQRSIGGTNFTMINVLGYDTP